MSLLKNIKYLFILLICASCADEEQRNSMQETNAVNFSVSVADLITSRATNDVWAADDEVGIYMVPAMATDTDTADFSTYSPESVNVPYRVPAAGTSVDLVAVSNAILYPT
ncbi:MAG: fimbrillin family protein, partial [Culturomica sp.]|nr:fimbrillin family protein [Culturomica sp.]